MIEDMWLKTQIKYSEKYELENFSYFMILM